MADADDDVDDDNESVDFDCESGIASSFKMRRATVLTKNTLVDSTFHMRHDGKFHTTLPTKDRCQYCFYYWRMLKTDNDRKKNIGLFQNRRKVSRCLRCNVNLCYSCHLDFHGISTQDLKAEFLKHKKTGKKK